MTNTITNDDDIIDSRDIIARIEELNSYDLSDLSDDDIEELRTLTALAEQGESESSDWRHGETLIHRRYWVDYVEELLRDCGDIPRNIPHYVMIDWEATADNIEADYATIDFDGVEYLIRSC